MREEAGRRRWHDQEAKRLKQLDDENKLLTGRHHFSILIENLILSAVLIKCGERKVSR